MTIDLDALDRLIAAAEHEPIGKSYNAITAWLGDNLPALIAELREARRDAERLSWIDRDDIGLTMGTDEAGGPFVVIQDQSGKLLAATSDIRSAIDAAIAASAREGER